VRIRKPSGAIRAVTMRRSLLSRARTTRPRFTRLDRELRQLETSPRLSEPYLDHLSEIYTPMTWAKGLAPDLQTEMERLTDQLPDD
jgi:hypothetical protein